MSNKCIIYPLSWDGIKLQRQQLPLAVVNIPNDILNIPNDILNIPLGTLNMPHAILQFIPLGQTLKNLPGVPVGNCKMKNQSVTLFEFKIFHNGYVMKDKVQFA